MPADFCHPPTRQGLSIPHPKIRFIALGWPKQLERLHRERPAVDWEAHFVSKPVKADALWFRISVAADPADSGGQDGYAPGSRPDSFGRRRTSESSGLVLDRASTLQLLSGPGSQGGAGGGDPSAEGYGPATPGGGGAAMLSRAGSLVGSATGGRPASRAASFAGTDAPGVPGSEYAASAAGSQCAAESPAGQDLRVLVAEARLRMCLTLQSHAQPKQRCICFSFLKPRRDVL